MKRLIILLALLLSACKSPTAPPPRDGVWNLSSGTVERIHDGNVTCYVVSGSASPASAIFCLRDS